VHSLHVYRIDSADFIYIVIGMFGSFEFLRDQLLQTGGLPNRVIFALCFLK
jgi:hypothetical protein